MKPNQGKGRGLRSGSRVSTVKPQSATSRLRIILADDHPVVRAGLRSALEASGTVDVIAEAGDGRTLLKQVEALHPAIVVADIVMPELNGIDATRAICAQHPDVRVLIVSMHCTEDGVRSAIEAGATGYVLKEAAIEELPRAVEALARSEAYFSPTVAKLLANRVAGRARELSRPMLSTREREVVQLISEGNSLGEIAARLFISRQTVKSHRTNAMHKLGCRTTADLVRHAIIHGLTPG